MLVSKRLPRFYAWQQKIEDERKLGQILLEGGEVETEAGVPLRRSADGQPRSTARTAIISKGIGGTAPGTDPLGALLRKESQRR